MYDRQVTDNSFSAELATENDQYQQDGGASDERFIPLHLAAFACLLVSVAESIINRSSEKTWDIVGGIVRRDANDRRSIYMTTRNVVIITHLSDFTHALTDGLCLCLIVGFVSIFSRTLQRSVIVIAHRLYVCRL